MPNSVFSVYFCDVLFESLYCIDFATADFHHIWPRNVVRCPVDESGKTFFHKFSFHFRDHLPPKSEIESRSNRHLTESRLQVICTVERYCLLHVVVQGPESFRDLVNFKTYDVRLLIYGASNLPNFLILAYFPIQNP